MSGNHLEVFGAFNFFFFWGEGVLQIEISLLNQHLPGVCSYLCFAFAETRKLILWDLDRVLIAVVIYCKKLNFLVYRVLTRWSD